MFEVHILNEDGVECAQQIQLLFEELLEDLENICGEEGHEMSIVRTKLQEAFFFAKRAMAMDPAFQAEPDDNDGEEE